MNLKLETEYAIIGDVGYGRQFVTPYKKHGEYYMINASERLTKAHIAKSFELAVKRTKMLRACIPEHIARLEEEIVRLEQRKAAATTERSMKPEWYAGNIQAVREQIEIVKKITFRIVEFKPTVMEGEY